MVRLNESEGLKCDEVQNVLGHVRLTMTQQHDQLKYYQELVLFDSFDRINSVTPRPNNEKSGL